MRTVENFLQAALKVNAEEEIEQAMFDTAQQYTDLQRAQMFAGIDNTGAKIHRVGKPDDYIYAEATIKAKQAKGQPTDRVTLKDTSSFYTDIFADPRSDGFYVDSADQKSAMLQENYTNKIFGLADNSKQRYADAVKPIYQVRIENRLNNAG